jgi:hypothetical protein
MAKTSIVCTFFRSRFLQKNVLAPADIEHSRRQWTF